MRWIETLKRRYARWLYACLQARLIADGHWDAQPGILDFMLVELRDREAEIRELSMEERLTAGYETWLTNVDHLLVQLNEATRTIYQDEYVDVAPADRPVTWMPLDEFLSDNYGRPLPLAVVIPQTAKVLSTYLATWSKVTKAAQKTYYARRYQHLLDESFRWLEHVLANYL